jgi:hypothetical protein
MNQLQLIGAALVVAVLAGVGLARNARAKRAAVSVAFFLPIAVVTLLAVFITFKSKTQWQWTACRLAPAIGLLDGYPLYADAKADPINGWLYGPISPLCWLPAGLASKPSSALATAEAINVAVLLVPLFFACVSAVGGSAHERLVGGWGGVVAAAATLLFYPTWYMAAGITSDTAAVGFGLVSCALLFQRQPRNGRLLAAAIFAAAAGWSKQIEVVLPLGQCLALVWLEGPRVAWRYALYAGAALVTFGLIFCGWFGAQALWLNMWQIPAHHPYPGGIRAMWDRTVGFFADTAVLWAVWIAFVVYRRRQGVRLADMRELVVMLPAIVLLPGGIIASCKFGGDRNSIHTVYYLLAAAVVVATVAWSKHRHAIWFLGASALLSLGLAMRAVSVYPAGGDVSLRDASDAACAFAREHPGEVYFPWDPLATAFAERKVYHLEYGVLDRLEAKLPITQAQYAAGLPPRLKYIVYPKLGVRPLAPDRVTGFDSHRFTESTEWVIYTRKE